MTGTEEATYRRVRFMAMLTSGPPDPLEWVLGTLKLVWGAWLLLPFSTFAAAPHLYRFVRMVPEETWGALFFVLGVMQWAAWYWQHNLSRFWCCMAAAAAWDWFGYEIWRADHRSSALVFFGVIAAGQILAVVWLQPRVYPRNVQTDDKD